MTLDDIKSQNAAAGLHFFEPATMRFFNSRTLSRVFDGPGGIYFVTSEKRTGFNCPDGKRLYTVRCFNPKTGDVKTRGEFQAYKTSKQALQRARECAFGTF
jgi:hypothetical protein